MPSSIKQLLYYITHIDNIPSIMKLGILSHAEIQSQNIQYTPIYDKKIISHRRNRTTPDNKSLWEYANLYFQPRNPMLYRVICEQSTKNIAVLGVDFDVIKLPHAFVTDGNAASISSCIVSAKEYKKVINSLKKVLNKEWWTDDDQIDSKRKIMAECLVPEKIEPNYIKEIYVADYSTAAEVKKKIITDIPIIPHPYMFFENPLIVELTKYLSVFKGDMFFSRMHTLTISVNTVGIMGKGLASRAKYQFPRVYVDYQDLCRRKILKMGKPYLYKREISIDIQLADEPKFTLKNGNSETWFLLFPTKRHWREKADFNGIEQGMQWLKENYKKEGIKSLAIPALGCGLGELNWENVGPMLCKYLATFDIPVQLYLPTEKQIPEQYLKKEFLLSLL